MALFKRKINLSSDASTGFGTNSENSGGFFDDRQTGAANVAKRGIGLLSRYSW